MDGGGVVELAPGDIHRPAPGPAPAAASAPQHNAAGEMSAEQQAGIAHINTLRAQAVDPALTREQREAVNQKIAQMQSHVFNGAPRPAWYGEQKPDPKQTDMRPNDPTRDAFEAAHAPATGEILKFAVDSAVVQGVDRQMAQQVVDMCGELELSGGAVKDILSRVRAHHGAELDRAPDTKLHVLAADERAEYEAVASKMLGSTERFNTLTERARAFLAHKGVLERFDRLGLTNSSLAYDPKLLLVLSYAADAAGLSKRGR